MEVQAMPSNVFPRKSGRFGARHRVAGKVVPLGTFDTEAEAWEAVAIAKRGEHIPEAELLVSELAQKWIDQHVATLAPATRRSYERARQIFERTFGAQRVVAVTRPELAAWALDQTEQDVRSIFSMFAWARTMRLLSAPENPMQGIKGRPPAKRHRYRVLTAEELEQLAAGADTLPALIAPAMRAITIVAGRTAIRPGELFALRWRDVDFEARTIEVRRSVDITGNEKAPKNGMERTVVLTREAGAALEDLGRRGPDDLIFTLAHGGQFKKTSLAYWFNKQRERAGFPDFRFYDLRHTALTYLYVDLKLPSYVVAAQAGHQDNGRLIERRYGHPQHMKALQEIRDAEDRVTAQTPPSGHRVTEGFSREARHA
jgi:integrase